MVKVVKIIIILVIAALIFIFTYKGQKEKDIKKAAIFSAIGAVIAFLATYIVDYTVKICVIYEKEKTQLSNDILFEGYTDKEDKTVTEISNQTTAEEKLDMDTQATTEESTNMDTQTTAEEKTDISTQTTASEEGEENKDVEYIKFMGENHTPSSFTNKVEMSVWENEQDYDLEGRTYNGGVKISIYNMFSALDGNSSSISTEIVSEIHYSLNRQAINNLKNEDRYFVGKFVVGEKTDASPSTAIISILVDGDEVYNSGEINCYSLDVPPFRVSLDQKKEMVIKIVCQHKGNPFIIGMVNNE